MTEPVFRCGFVAIVGRPNVGKSTLLNHLVGQKISITSDKAQTTRRRINGISNLKNAQIIFTDTPGWQNRRKGSLNLRLNRNVAETVAAVDAVIFVVDASRRNEEDEKVLALLPEKTPVLLALNKIDRVKDPERRESVLRFWRERRDFVDAFAVSAKHGRGIDELSLAAARLLPAGPPLYPEDMPTDQPLRFLAGEIIREKLFRLLGRELPYSLHVDIERFEEDEKLCRIDAVILVERESQKAIVIGRGGEKLKRAATGARLDMEKLFGGKVFLGVRVKTKSGWAEDAAFLRDL